MKNAILFFLSLIFLSPTTLINAVDGNNPKKTTGNPTLDTAVMVLEIGGIAVSTAKFAYSTVEWAVNYNDNKRNKKNKRVADILTQQNELANLKQQKEIDSLKNQKKIDDLERKNESLEQKIELVKLKNQLAFSRFQRCLSKHDNETCLKLPEFATFGNRFSE